MFNNLFQRVLDFWQKQSNTRRIVIIVIALLLLIVVPVIFVWASTPTYGVAFSGLSEADAGKVIEQLTAEGIPYQIRNGTTVLVPSDKVYEVRLKLASQGSFQSGSVGFELFSGNTLGMTEFTQKVNYQRALEGELERTISSIEAVESVRVHIVTPEKALLSSNQQPTTAAITVQEKVNQKLDAAQVRAMTYLVANAVEGLKPENVTIVDGNGNLLASGSGDSGYASQLSQIDSRRSSELVAAAELQKKVEELLQTALGPNRSVVQANVTMDWRDREVKTQAFEPTQVAIRSSQKINESYVTNGEIGGIPGAASNLPTPVPSQYSTSTGELVYVRNEETLNYEITSTETTEVIHPGEIQRISLSVLVDGVTDTVQLADLQTAIIAAAGIDLARGDIISVRSMNFDRSTTTAEAAAAAESERNDLLIKIAEIIAAVLIILFVLFYVMRLLRNLRTTSVEVWSPALKPGEMPQLAGQNAPQLTAEMPVSPQGLPVGQPTAGGLPQPTAGGASQPVIPPLPMPRREPKKPQLTAEDEQMQRVVARLAEDNPARVAEILQLWLNEDKR
ncbi:MAG TPA: flagellar basal-body MS-ring/collar protein FliF [Anaerolineaceae bacterium]|nr:flagellar basal-body MS-ring/collar protein FliF [Anaerolineaceae bacterium]HPN52564.1 flagellar basal-body MS-ring/collar protein FliF [Anaerolineaceae bacterium]